MRYARALWGVGILFAAISSAQAGNPTDTGALAPKQIVTGTFACLLGPMTHQHDAQIGGRWAKSAGFTAERCIAAAEAGRVSLSSLAKGDKQATAAIRRALENRIARDMGPSVEAGNLMTFFDRGVAAANEARRSARSHGELAKLYQFGRNLGTTEMATEAQSLAWIIGVERLLTIQDLPEQLKLPVAEPFFAVLLNVAPPVTAEGRAEPTWKEYLAEAAQSTRATTAAKGTSPRAIGGGPTSEEANLGEIARASEERLRAIAQRLEPSSDIRVEVERTMAKLRTLERQP
jgi:hypothetical protein